MTAAHWTPVCALQDVVPGTGVCALVDGRQVAVVRVGEGNEVYAIDNFDPFGKAFVLSRGIVGDLKGELVVASPVFKQHFSLTTGRCIEDPDVQLPVYAVRLEADLILVES